MDKELLQKEREEMAKRQEEEKRKLQLEKERVRMEKELEQKKAPVIEMPVSKITNGDVMSAAPKQQLGMSQSPRNRYSPQNGHGQSPRNGHSPRTVSPGLNESRRITRKICFQRETSHQAIPLCLSTKKTWRYKILIRQVNIYLTDPNIPVNQHWLIEEAERRRRAEVQGVERKMPPDVIIPPHGDLQAPQKATHSRQPKAYPRGFNPEIPTKIPAQRKLHSQEAPASTNAAQRRLRRPEAEADRQRKMKNRRSLPDDMAGGRDNAVPGHGHSNNQTHGGQTTEPPISRSSDRGQHSIPGQGSAFQEPNKNIPPNQSVSGKLQCCNCGKSLGRGAAMIIESLGLHYHVECFRRELA
ncbi:putative trichohyalin isoform X2 [Apostichopus japonicus]|uniref:Putative trichohyalin isoform X2 n=1 Tax=Stichopus japonicus TaxID=307972 RepID=A0A2G8K8J8_STIJA|nr:putative trichohyalin isoform X2 [Apostichopus japonicus]